MFAKSMIDKAKLAKPVLYGPPPAVNQVAAHTTVITMRQPRPTVLTLGADSSRPPRS